jgi:hypothetical protein
MVAGAVFVKDAELDTREVVIEEWDAVEAAALLNPPK